MFASLVDLVTGAGLQLALLLLGLLPSVDVASLPIAPPASVLDALGMLNVFLPVGDLLTILTVWVGAVLAANVAFAIAGIVNSFR